MHAKPDLRVQISNKIIRSDSVITAVIPLKLKLWTLQHRKLSSSSENRKIVSSWERTPQNWRNAYRWMVSQWQTRLGLQLDSAPIWCWHSCNGKLHSPPTVGTAALLMGDYAYYRDSTIVLEIDVPESFCLLSSYFVWNDAVDDFFENKRITIAADRFDNMFDEPLIRHDTDDVQAVIPYILSEWIADIRDLPDSDADWDIAV